MHMFNRDNEKYYGSFIEKSKEFIGNAITAIDVHPTRPEFVALGFQKGHIVLLDVISSPQKSLKIVKDQLKQDNPITNIKFCDWNGPPVSKNVGKFLSMVKKDTKDHPDE